MAGQFSFFNSPFTFSKRRQMIQAWSSRSSRRSSTSNLRSEYKVQPCYARPSGCLARRCSMPDFESDIFLLQREKTLEALVSTLLDSGLDGPTYLINYPEKIGEGGQFYVYKQQIGLPQRNTFPTRFVAVKRPKFPESFSTKLDLANPDVYVNLHHIYLEVKALTDKRLRGHPNIVKLLAWSIEDYNWRKPFALVLELAFSDLETFLEQEGDQVSWLTKLLLCDDVAAGLDAIHNSGFVHGDLKPANILLFNENERNVAKLADFGFAAEEGSQNAGGTAGWQAPEMVTSYEADRFSYGLLLWSVFFGFGKPLPTSREKSAQDLAIQDLEKYRDIVGERISATLREAFRKLLQLKSQARPEHVSGLLDDAIETNFVRTIQPGAELPTTNNLFESKFSWEIPALSEFFFDHLHRRFLQNQNRLSQMPPEYLFAMALHFTQRPLERLKTAEYVLPLLLSAAKRGFQPAQAVVHRAYKFYGSTPENTVEAERHEWLKSAVLGGSTLARTDIKIIDAASFHETLHTFHDLGGYNQMYCDMNPSVNPSPLVDDMNTAYSLIHWLSAFGSLEELTDYLEFNNHGHMINSKTNHQETPLYLASARGSWPHVVELLKYGADPRIRCTQFGISCLHWVFSFDENTQPVFVRKLVEGGADVNALVVHEVPFPHYPFELPSGTPLHWAVAVSSHVAVRVLIAQGADPLMRNRCDPYMYDDRVRRFYTFGGPNQEAQTFQETWCQGLSPLDLAAIHRDPFIFEMLASQSQTLDMNSADEEGFTVLHRLGCGQVFRTSCKSQYSPGPFRNSKTMDLTSIITRITEMGGDVNRLTSSAIPEHVQKQRKQYDIPSYTPLMLAMLGADCDLVHSLIACGASVHTSNLWGKTALLCLSDRAFLEEEASLECVKRLINHGANVDHRCAEGSSALLGAAMFSLYSHFELLLSLGADIDERDVGEDKANPGRNVFAFLAQEEPAFESFIDRTVARLLKEYVVTAKDQEKRNRVINVGDIDGQTLIHRFASRSMPYSVEVLLQNGAQVNPRYVIHSCVTIDGQQMKKTWVETPMDAVEDSKWWREHRMQRDKQLLCQVPLGE